MRAATAVLLLLTLGATLAVQVTKKYYIEEINANNSFVRAALNSRGWEEQKSGKYGLRGVVDLKWTFSPTRIYKHVRPSSIVNHFESGKMVTDKDSLAKNLRESYSPRDLAQFVPRSYRLDDPTEHEAFLADFAATFARAQGATDATLEEQTTVTGVQPSIDGSRNIWIVKPGAFARGVGIQLFNNLSRLLEYSANSAFGPFVAQKYIETPLIVNKYKFDIRQFVLVTSLEPLTIYMFDDCYLRFSTVEYNADDVDNTFIHLTNHQVQKESATYGQTEFTESQWSLQRFEEHLLETTGRSNLWRSVVRPQIVDVVVHTLMSWPAGGHRDNSFVLLGFDILLDAQHRPWLLEVNESPGLHALTDVVRSHHPRAVDGIFTIVIDNKDIHAQTVCDSRSAPLTAASYSSNANRCPEELLGGWQLVYRGARNP